MESPGGRQMLMQSHTQPCQGPLISAAQVLPREDTCPSFWLSLWGTGSSVLPPFFCDQCSSRTLQQRPRWTCPLIRVVGQGGCGHCHFPHSGP